MAAAPTDAAARPARPPACFLLWHLVITDSFPARARLHRDATAARPAIVRRMTTPDDCYTCTRTAEGSQAAPFERIAADENWRLADAFNSALPGWLVLVPLRQCSLQRPA